MPLNIKNLQIIASSICISLFVFSCRSGIGSDSKENLSLAASLKGNLGTPDRSEIRHPSGAPGQDEVALGKLLFFDKRLSKDFSRSCSTCHNPESGFGDALPTSIGLNGKPLKRNAQHLFNLAWSNVMFWDGRAASLEEQALIPISDPNEMGLPLEELLERLRKVDYYVSTFSSVFPDEGISTSTVARAIASFERSIISDNSPFDRFVAGNKDALSPSAKAGLDLFQNKAGCIQCHSGPNFTDNDFHNTGVPGEDRGRHDLDRIGHREFAFTPYPFFANNRSFKTPGLRNAELTAPYFHDGSESTLHDVVRFYNGGGKVSEKTGLARGIKPLGLTESNIDDIVEFLKSLTTPVLVPIPEIP